MLAVEIEYLNRVSYAARFDTPNEPEWPPHPDRLFMAMTAAWGESGGDHSEESALRWLEMQAPPEIVAPKASARDSFRNFVPTSSNAAYRTSYLDGANILQLHDSIVRKERQFPAMVLPDDDFTVYMIWRDAEPGNDTRDALDRLAKKVSRVGHSASLVRVALCDRPVPEPTHVPHGKGSAAYIRCPGKGRLDTLMGEFGGSESAVPSRPGAAKATIYGDMRHLPPASAMGDENEWIVLSFSGEPPALTSFPPVAKTARDAVMSHVQGEVHEVVSGHAGDRTPAQNPHMAIVPMANVGWDRPGRPDGSLMGLALVLPRKSVYGTPERRQVRQAVARFLESGGDLVVGTGGRFRLGRDARSRKSLMPGRYTQQASIWQSVTPVVLDHHPKRNKSPASIVADACQKIGLPRPSHAHTARHSSASGAPPAYVKKGGGSGWHHPKPGFLDNKYVCHATVEFELPVQGPVMLGAGRYYGLGLFIPAERRQ